ncbi:purine permease 1-like [Syzygium oleosum]|uniref:purine permease 1-like n=1 Tax=Syzygium oleosum TaxID=219896 RepID=UPI0024BB5289|nr:purine permease 1-like [Syzygium oleosum]
MGEIERASESESLIMGESMEAPQDKTPKRLLLALNCAMLSLGTCGSPLLMRLYFVRGGTCVWLCSWLETGGWPIIVLPLTVAYFRRRSAEGPSAHLVLMDPFLFAASAVIGVLTGLDDYLYAYGAARLPVSTSALLIATQLSFTAGFAFLLVRQQFTSYSINSIFLLTIGAGVLAMDTSSDRPAGESDSAYYAGFFMTLGAAALYGFVLPLVELTYKKAKQAVTYSLVLEFQLVMCFFATAFCTVGMLINKDFQVLSQPRPIHTGDSYRSKELRAWRSHILCGARVERDHQSILFLRSHRSHLLCLLSILRNHHRRSSPGHRDPSRHNLPGEVPGRERRVPRPLALGLRFVFLRRIQSCQEGKRKSSSRLDLQRPKCISKAFPEGQKKERHGSDLAKIGSALHRDSVFGQKKNNLVMSKTEGQ